MSKLQQRAAASRSQHLKVFCKVRLFKKTLSLIVETDGEMGTAPCCCNCSNQPPLPEPLRAGSEFSGSGAELSKQPVYNSQVKYFIPF